jgi:hypothetical protein
MKLILTASAVLIGSTCALAEAPVSLVQAQKIKDALQARGCFGGKMEMDTDQEGKPVYEVEGAVCRDGQFDLTLDKDFKVVEISPSEPPRTGPFGVLGKGSCLLGDVMDEFSEEKPLINEIETQLSIQKIDVNETQCGADLLYIGGDDGHARVAPYIITIGSKTLTIFSKIVLLSKRGDRLPDDAFDRAYSFREEGITWVWN